MYFSEAFGSASTYAAPSDFSGKWSNNLVTRLDLTQNSGFVNGSVSILNEDGSVLTSGAVSGPVFGRWGYFTVNFPTERRAAQWMTSFSPEDGSMLVLWAFLTDPGSGDYWVPTSSGEEYFFPDQ